MTTIHGRGAAATQRREFDTLCFPRHPFRRPARVEDLPKAAEFVARLMPQLALGDLSRFARLVQFDPDTIQLFLHDERIVGLYCMLFLRDSGLKALVAGNLDLTDPALEHLAAPPEPPRAIYNWLVIGPGSASTGISAISKLLSQDRYAAADLYARPETPGGRRIMTNVGFQPIPGNRAGMYRYVRLRNRHNSSMGAV